MSSKVKLREDIKKIVRSILLSAPRGLSVRELMLDFKALEGYPLPFKEMGYISANEFFEENNDAVHLSWMNGTLMVRGIADDSTAHIQRMVSRQRNTSKTSRVVAQKVTDNQKKTGPHNTPNIAPFTRKCILELLAGYPDGILGTCLTGAFTRRFGYQLNFSKQGFASLRDMLNSLSGSLQLTEVNGVNGSYRVCLKQNTSIQKQLAKNSPIASGSGRVNENNHYNNTHHLSEQETITSRSLNSSAPSFNRGNDATVDLFAEGKYIPDYVQQNIKKVLKSFQFGLCSNRLIQEYKRIIGEDLPLAECGHVSIIELMTELPQLVDITRPTQNGDWLLFDTESQEKNSDTRPVIDWKNTIKNIVEQFPEGLLTRLIPDRYQELIGLELKPVEIGFTSLNDMLHSMNGSHIHLEVVNGKFNVFPLSSKQKKTASNTIVLNMDSVVQQPLPVGYRQSIPPDSVGASVCFSVQKFPNRLINSENYVEVYVSQVDSPGKFYIQLKADTTTEALEDIMDELETMYYGPNSLRYVLPSCMVRVGQICTAIFPEDNNWHRSIIIKILNSNTVEVYFVDYGNKCIVDVSHCRLLQSKFLSLPAQAIQAKLANVVPSNGSQWTRSSQQRLLGLVNNRCICALIVDNTNQVCSVFLCDTTSIPDEDIHVIDVLVNEGYAVLSTDPFDQRDFDFETMSSSSAILTEDEEKRPDMLINDVPSLHRLSTKYLTPENTEKLVQQKLPEECEFKVTDGEEEEEDEYIRYVQVNRIHGYNDVHVVNYGGTAYITSGDISQFLWNTDQLKLSLRQKRLAVPKVMVSTEDDPELFEEFLYYGVKSTKDVDTVTIYELRSVPRILESFKCSSPIIVDAFKEIYRTFNSEDPYWQGLDEDESLEECNASPACENTLHDQLGRMQLFNPVQSSKESLTQSDQLMRKVRDATLDDRPSHQGASQNVDKSSQQHLQVDDITKLPSMNPVCVNPTTNADPRRFTLSQQQNNTFMHATQTPAVHTATQPPAVHIATQPPAVHIATQPPAVHTVMTQFTSQHFNQSFQQQFHTLNAAASQPNYFAPQSQQRLPSSINNTGQSVSNPYQGVNLGLGRGFVSNTYYNHQANNSNLVGGVLMYSVPHH